MRQMFSRLIKIGNGIEVLWLFRCKKKNKKQYYYYAGDMVDFAAIRIKYGCGHK